MKQMTGVDSNNSFGNGCGGSSSVKKPFFSLGFLRHKNKSNYSVLVKLALCFLALGVSYRLFSSNFILFSPPAVDVRSGNEAAPPPEPEDQSLAFYNETCDLFSGSWVPDSSGPVYTNESCPLIEGHQNCMKNGRPDEGFLYWRWVPSGCELPRFQPRRFLGFMRNKEMAFIGDSISRNHVQSFICTLSQVEQAVEVYHDKEYKSKRWSFPHHNFSVSVIWTPFLVKAAVFEDDNGVSSGAIQLHLDRLDAEWVEQYQNYDYAVIAGGKWFLKNAIYHENNTILGCHNCQEKNTTELGFEHAYRRVLQFVLNFVTSSKHKAYVFFRTSAPDHFENGEWNSGGYCNRTSPFEEGEAVLSDVDRIMREIELEEFEKAKRNGTENKVTLKLFDTTNLSLLRPDGHPGVYRMFHPYAGKDKNATIQNDCLHWCLPGPIDTWSDLMMRMILNDPKV